MVYTTKPIVKISVFSSAIERVRRFNSQMTSPDLTTAPATLKNLSDTPTFADALKFIDEQPQHDLVTQEEITTENFSRVTCGILSAALKVIPQVGGLLGAMLIAMWPKVNQKGPLNCQQSLDAEIDKEIGVNNSSVLRDLTRGFYNAIHEYVREPDLAGLGVV